MNTKKATQRRTKAKCAKRTTGNIGGKRISALDAAASVLAKAKTPMTARELITAMANKGLWSSPGGKTLHATLYAAMFREIKTKGRASRFTKAERGRFALTS